VKKSIQLFLSGLLIIAPLKLTAIDASSFNVYVIDDIGTSSQAYGSDFQGIAGAGGNVYFSGMSLNANNTVPSSLYSLYTQGNVTYQSGQINNGGIQAGGNINFSSGSVSGSVNSGGNLNGSGGSISGNAVLGGVNNSSLSINGTVSQHQSFTPGINYSSLDSFFSNASQYWSSQAQNVTNYTIGGNNTSLTINSTLVAGHNILNLTAAQFSSLTSLTVSGPSNSFLIINVNGTNVTSQLTNFNLSGSGFNINNVLVNLPQATTATINGGASLLAPLANVTYASGALNGDLVAENLYGSGQVNQGAFIGYANDKGLTVPEPSGYMVMGSFLLLTTLAGYRKLGRTA
jgi:choice-of-anchor A domain-containing protein